MRCESPKSQPPTRLSLALNTLIHEVEVELIGTVGGNLRGES